MKMVGIFCATCTATNYLYFVFNPFESIKIPGKTAKNFQNFEMMNFLGNRAKWEKFNFLRFNLTEEPNAVLKNE